MNNIGRNKRIWLEKQGCVFVDKIEYFSYSTQIYTQHGEYVGLADLGKNEETVNFIYKHRLTNLMCVNRALGLPLSTTGCNAVSVGFNEKEQTWYGWTHRGWGKFFISYEIVNDGIIDNIIKNNIRDHGACFLPFKVPFKAPFTVNTLEEAKFLAAIFADDLD